MSDVNLLSGQAPQGAGSGESKPAEPQQAEAAPAAQATPASESTSTFDANALAYGSSLPKRLQNAETFAMLTPLGKNAEHLVDGYLSASGKLKEYEGRKLIPAEWGDVPESDDGYQFDRSGDLARLPVLEGLDAKVAGIMRKLGIPAGLAKAYQKEVSMLSLEIADGMRAKNEAAVKTAVAEFEKLSGRNHKEAMAELGEVARTYMDQETWARFERGENMANDPKFLMFLIGAKRGMQDSRMVAAGGAGGDPKAKTSLDAIRASRK